MPEGEINLARHADKGKWTINAQELRTRLSEDEATLVETILREQFSQLREIPLKLDGVVRSLRMGDSLFASLPNKSVLVVTDSGRDRAQLTRAFVTARIAQRETQYNEEHVRDKKRIDILHVDDEEITKLMADTHPDTWVPYAKMMEVEGISENEGVARQLHDLNKPDAAVDPRQHPKESAERYRSVIQKLRTMVTSEQVPVAIFGIGHSGPLGQIRYEHQEGVFTADDTPQFCELFSFNDEGRLVGTKGVKL